MIFYWTFYIINEKIKENRGREIYLKAKLVKVASLVNEVKRERKKRILNKGLLTFLQQVSSSLNLSDKLLTIKSGLSKGNMEVVNARFESMNMKEIVYLLKEIEKYGNIEVRSFVLKKRFDDPGFADVHIEIVKAGGYPR